MVRSQLRSLPFVFAVCATACSGSDADCGRLGDKFVELYMGDLSEDTRKLAPEVLDNAAEAGRVQVVKQCKKERFSKQSIQRCLEATTLTEFKQC